MAHHDLAQKDGWVKNIILQFMTLIKMANHNYENWEILGKVATDIRTTVREP